MRILGKPLVIHACGLERYEYSDSNVPDGEQNDPRVHPERRDHLSVVGRVGVARKEPLQLLLRAPSEQQAHGHHDRNGDPS